MSTGSITAETGTARFSRHVALTFGARILIAGGSMLAGVIVARWLGAASVGVVASLNVITLIALTFGGFGLPSAVTYLVARDKERLKPLATIASSYALIAGVVLALGVVLLTMLKPSLFGTTPLGLVVIAAIAIPFQMLTQFCMSAFLGIGDIGRYNLFDLASQGLLILSPLVALVLLGLGLLSLVTMNTTTAAALSVVVLLILIRTANMRLARDKFRFDLDLMREMFHYGLKFYVAMLSSAIIFRADLLIVNYFRDSAEAGVYAVSTQVGTLLMLIPNVISTVLFPRVSESNQTSSEMTCRVTRHTVLIMLAVAIAAIPAAFVLPLLYGPAFEAVPWQVVILLPGVYLLGLETVQVQYFNSQGLPKLIPLFWVGSMILFVTLDLIFVPSFGAYAAAAVSCITYSLMFVLVATYFRIRTGISFRQSFLMNGEEFRSLFAFSSQYER